MDWYVCLYKTPGENNVQVKIVEGDYVPKKGEELQIIGLFHSKGNAECLENAPHICKVWGINLFLTDETMYDYLPAPDGR